METFVVECLRCGQLHQLSRESGRRLSGRECPRCGYLGWAGASELDEPARRALRDRFVTRRRLKLAS